MFERLKSSNEAIVIAEVGQNHQGSFDTAVEYIHRLSTTGTDFVKFQVRDNKSLFSSKAYNKAYESENALGLTYGEHGEELE